MIYPHHVAPWIRIKKDRHELIQVYYNEKNKQTNFTAFLLGDKWFVIHDSDTISGRIIGAVIPATDDASYLYYPLTSLNEFYPMYVIHS